VVQKLKLYRSAFCHITTPTSSLSIPNTFDSCGVEFGGRVGQCGCAPILHPFCHQSAEKRPNNRHAPIYLSSSTPTHTHTSFAPCFDVAVNNGAQGLDGVCWGEGYDKVRECCYIIRCVSACMPCTRALTAPLCISHLYALRYKAHLG